MTEGAQTNNGWTEASLSLALPGRSSNFTEPDSDSGPSSAQQVAAGSSMALRAQYTSCAKWCVSSSSAEGL